MMVFLISERRTNYHIRDKYFRFIQVDNGVFQNKWPVVGACMCNLRSSLQHDVVMCLFTASAKRAIEGQLIIIFKSVNVVAAKTLLKHLVKLAKSSRHVYRCLYTLKQCFILIHIHNEDWYGKTGFNESDSSQSLSTHCLRSSV